MSGGICEGVLFLIVQVPFSAIRPSTATMPKERAIRILRNIPKRVVAIHRHQGEAEIDTMMKSAVRCLTILSRIRGVSDKMMIEAWEIYSRLQKMSGTIPNKFLDNDHNNPRRVQPAAKHRIRGTNWDQFFISKLRGFDQFYRHGMGWVNGRKIWKSTTATLSNTQTSDQSKEK